MATSRSAGGRAWLERVGRRAVEGVEEVGVAGWLLAQSLFFLGLGRRVRQPVRLGPVVNEMMQIGIAALPITTLLSATIGLMLALQGEARYFRARGNELQTARASGDIFNVAHPEAGLRRPVAGHRSKKEGGLPHRHRPRARRACAISESGPAHDTATTGAAIGSSERAPGGARASCGVGQVASVFREDVTQGMVALVP